jgi:glycine oxidase
MPKAPEIIVIGAGIVGCAVAEELARRGAAVTIVDARRVGMGATQASAGVLAPFIEAGERDDAFLDLGVRSLALYDEFVNRATAASGVRVEYRRTGTLEVAETGERMTTLRHAAERLRARGVACELLDAAGARREEPHLAPDVFGGLVIPSHGFVNPADLTRALGLAASCAGAELVEDVEIRKITQTNTRVGVEADGRAWHADAAVLAAGSWSGRVDIDGVNARVPVRPVRGQLLHVAWTGPLLKRSTWGERCYLVPWQDGTLLVGATVEDAGFDERTTVAGVRDLLEAVCDLVPHAWTGGFRAARVGLRPGTPDDLPVIGFSSVLPNLFYATGHYRNGVLLAPLTAKLVADAVLDHRIDPALERLAPSRFGAL